MQLSELIHSLIEKNNYKYKLYTEELFSNKNKQLNKLNYNK